MVVVKVTGLLRVGLLEAAKVMTGAVGESVKVRELLVAAL
jgi:hypothetical protein